MARRTIAAWALAGLATAPAMAQDVPLKPVSGTEVARRTASLTGEIRWQRSAAAALERSRAGGRMVFWLQAVGDLAGGL